VWRWANQLLSVPFPSTFGLEQSGIDLLHEFWSRSYLGGKVNYEKPPQEANRDGTDGQNSKAAAASVLPARSQQQITAVVAWGRRFITKIRLTEPFTAAPNARKPTGIVTRQDAKRYKPGNHSVARRWYYKRHCVEFERMPTHCSSQRFKSMILKSS
jgi:hypothetical protein